MAIATVDTLASAPDHWASAIRQRRKALLQRLGMAAASALVFSPLIGWDVSVAWVVGYFIVQALDLWIFAPIISARTERLTGFRSIAGGVFSPDEPDRYADLMDAVCTTDWFMLAADFDAYAAAQRDVDAKFVDTAAWGRSAVLNVANMGWFSSDRTIGEYAKQIWGVM